MLRTEMQRCEAVPGANPLQSLLITSAAVRRIAHSPVLTAPLSAYLGENVVPFSAFFLDKSSARNWQMPWHQNLRIPVASASAATMVENGVPHLIPDAAYLEKVLILRISLDAQTAENGGLEIIPGSHRHGILSEDAVVESGGRPEAFCPSLQVGSIFVFQALLVHRSRPSTTAQPRRILQLEYAAKPPPGFAWFGL